MMRTREKIKNEFYNTDTQFEVIKRMLIRHTIVCVVATLAVVLVSNWVWTLLLGS